MRYSPGNQWSTLGLPLFELKFLLQILAKSLLSSELAGVFGVPGNQTQDLPVNDDGYPLSS